MMNEDDRLSAALEALKVAREALRRCTTGIQHSHDDFWRVDDGAMDDALAALARIDALIGGNDHEN